MKRTKSAAVLLAAACIAVFSCGLSAQEVVVTELKGSVEIFSNNAWTAMSSGQVLKGMEKIRTGANSYCSLLFMQGHELKVNPGTEIELSKLSANETEIRLTAGKSRAKVKKLASTEGFNMKTPAAICSVRGTEFSVEYLDNLTKVEVYEGVVSAKEEATGGEVTINPGEFSVVEYNKPPSQPQPIPEAGGGEINEGDLREQMKYEARMEMFNEISREQVMARAADEIKLAEFQNGKALTDVSGMRVRLEEYVVRPEGSNNQFKYVVLNTRENRFDFATILYEFTLPAGQASLPSDLTLVTKEMFIKPGTAEPDYKLDRMDSVCSNTYDKIVEECWDGIYSQVGDNMTLDFNNKRFYIGNADSTANEGKGNLRYRIVNGAPMEFFDTDGGALGAPTSSELVPVDSNSLHNKYVDTYSDGFALQYDSYLINDDGKCDKASIANTIGSTDDYSMLNYEFVYTSADFSDAYDNKIDVVGSLKLLKLAGFIY